jgi:hypothetical protein
MWLARELIVLAMLVLGGVADAAFGCSCVGYSGPCEAYDRAEVVFVGPVREISETTTELGAGAERMKFPARLVRLGVEERFKGVDTPELVVRTGLGGGDCGFQFEKGERYLVYASRTSAGLQLETNICTRTRAVTRAKDDLDYLRTLPASRLTSRISGSVELYAHDAGKRGWHLVRPLPGITVVTDGVRGHYETVTDAEGYYKLVGIPAGEYRIKARLPAKMTTRDSERQVKLSENGCAELSIAVEYDVKISGHVHDDQGRPLKEIQVQIVNVAHLSVDKDRAYPILMSKTDSGGHYEFDLVPPGRYVVGVNIASEPSLGIPFPRTFVPGVPDKTGASVIRVSEGQKVHNLDLQLPPRLPIYDIDGVLLRSDSSPVPNVTIYITASEESNSPRLDSTDTDSRGRFILGAFRGAECWIHVESRDGSAQPEVISFRPVKLTMRDNIPNLVLILGKK